ncbi:carboxylesterase 1 [Cajanus cajan]|uniref:Gibberellin receptor GID1L2 n=1 Tax=Cajanus cajan TaxID=3821 RepID=A0A151R3L9_CAJCA|nr:carboxylesterase 1 [Cajanus cajan]KYP37055.1 putative gibberellin receptor GID1L2 [Cajanus cajan]
MSKGVDPLEHLKIELNPDGTITRVRGDKRTPARGDPSLPIPVLTEDATINESNKTFARIFLPRKALHNSTKVPLIVYFHGGGFVLFSAASDFFQDACANLANDVNSIVVSVEYRLAPEHRLPAAYEDAVEALHWLKLNSHSHHWLKNHADFSNCYLMGSSAGANIAYHAALRVHHLDPLKIRGLILSQPFFGGTKRLPSEVRLADDPVLPPHVCDLLWELSLPVGADRDHEYCNPRARAVILDRVRELTWRVLVSGCHGDPLVDHQIAFARLMEEKGVQVLTCFTDGGCHGAEVRYPIHQNHLHKLVKHFIR